MAKIKKLERYDIFIDTLTHLVLCYAGKAGTNLYELLHTDHGANDITNFIPDYKPLHLGKYYGFKGFDKQLKLLSRRKGKRPTQKTIDKFIK